MLPSRLPSSYAAELPAFAIPTTSPHRLPCHGLVFLKTQVGTLITVNQLTRTVNYRYTMTCVHPDAANTTESMLSVSNNANERELWNQLPMKMGSEVRLRHYRAYRRVS